MSQERKSVLSRLFGGKEVPTPRGAYEALALWKSLDAVIADVRSIQEGAGALAPKLARHGSLVEAAVDRARGGRGRVRELREGVLRLGSALERLDVVALNAALEAARLGEGRGLPLTLVADEVKGHVARGLAALEELRVAVDEADREIARCEGQLELASGGATELLGGAAGIQEGARAAAEGADDLAVKLRAITGSDAETSQALAAAVDHAKALADALTTLGGRVPRALVVAALRPVLEPLFGLVDDEGREEGP